MACKPRFCWSLLTSEMIGIVLNSSTILGANSIEIVQIVALHGELVLRVALPAADAQILRGLQVQGGAGQLGQLRPQPRDDEVGRDLPLFERL